MGRDLYALELADAHSEMPTVARELDAAVSYMYLLSITVCLWHCSQLHLEVVHGHHGTGGRGPFVSMFCSLSCATYMRYRAFL